LSKSSFSHGLLLRFLALSFFFERLFRHTGTSITFENRGTPVPFASTNDRRRRRVKTERAVADTKTEDEEGVPRDDDATIDRES